MVRLTPEQALAAAALDRLVNIVSAPGSGKTTVAAERFGYQRHLVGDDRGVLGLCFNRATVAELRARISARWGGGAIAPPHRVVTFDHLHVELLHRLLDAGLVNWPNGLRELDVRDDYRGTPWVPIPDSAKQLPQSRCPRRTPQRGLQREEGRAANNRHR